MKVSRLAPNRVRLAILFGLLPFSTARASLAPLSANPSVRDSSAIVATARETFDDQAEIDLALVKSHSGNFNAGRTGTYTLTVTNIGALGTSAATTITDNLPVGLTFVSGTGTGWTCSAVGQAVTCSTANLFAPSQTSQVSLVVAVGAAAVPSVINTAVVSTAGEPATRLANNTSSDPTTVQPEDPFIDLAMAKSHTGNFIVGTNATYTLGVTNLGPRTTIGPITVLDTLPVGLTVVSATGAGWTCSTSGQELTCTNPGPLAQNQSSSITLVVAVGAAAVPSVVNRAHVLTPGEPPVYRTNNSASDPTTVVPQPLDLAITKLASSPFVVGQNGTFSLTVSNGSPTATSGTTTVTDVLPTGLTFVSATGTGWTCGAVAQTVTCSTATILAPGASSTITLTVAVGLAALPSVTNTATVTTPGDSDPANDQSTAIVPVTVLDLALTKSHVGNFVVGQAHDFTLLVTNVGTEPTTGPITVHDTLPATLSFVSATGPGWSCSNSSGRVTCTNPGPLAPGASSSITLRVNVNPGAYPSVINRANVVTPGDPNPGNDTGTDPVTVNDIDLTIAKVATGPFVVGSPGSYNITVSNLSPVPTNRLITVTDTVPAGLTFVSVSGTGWTCSNAGAVVTCTTPGPVAGGSSAPPITLNVTVGAAAIPSVTNRAWVQMLTDLNPANNSATVTTPVTFPPPDLAIVKLATSAFSIGQNATYSLTVTNLSLGPTTGITVVTDVLPVGLTFVSATAPGWSCSGMGNTVTCLQPAPIPPGASETITLTVAVGAAASPSVTNTGTVQTPGDTDPTNDTSTVTVSVNALDLSIVKSHTGSFTVGSNHSYQLLVSNVSSLATTGAITVVDNLPAGLTFVSAAGPGWSCQASGATVSCTNPGPLAPGASSAITLTVLVGPTAFPGVTNVATVSTPNDVVPGNDTSSDPTTVVAPPSPNAPDLSITKTGPPSFTVGQNGIYTLTVRNVGAGPATGVTTVTDVLAPGLTFVSATGAGWSCGFSAGTVTCATSTTFAPNAVSTITITVAVGAAAAPSVINSATVQTSGDPNPGNDTSTITTPVGSGPGGPFWDLEIVKTSGTLISGTTGTFSLAVRNTGIGPTPNVITVSDTLPTGLTFASASGGLFTCSAVGQVVTCIRTAPLAVLEVAVINIVVNVVAAPGSIVTNRGVVKTPGDINPLNDSSTVVVPVGGGPANPPDLALSKTVVGTVVAGQNMTFRLTITNVGAGPTTGVITLTDPLPAGFTYVSASGAPGSSGWSCSATGQSVTCTNPGPLAPGATTAVDLVAMVAPSARSFVNTGTVKTPGDPNPTNDTSSIGQEIRNFIDLETIKTAALPNFTVGQPASYTITVRNVGTMPTTGLITIVDVVPNGLVPVSATGPGWTCTITGQTVGCSTPGPLAPNQSASVTLTANAVAAASPSVRNSARGSSTGDGNQTNDTSTVTTPVGAVIDLTLAKEAVGTFRVSTQGRYTLTVRNVGINDAPAPIVVRDTLPAGLTFVSAQGTGWTCSATGNVVTCTRNTVLAAGAVSTIDLTVALGNAALPQVTNCATVTGTGETGSLTNNQGCTSTPVAGEPRLEITKTVARQEAQIGDVLDYTMVVRNTGTADVLDAIIVDDLPLGMAYEPRTARLNNTSLADPTGAPGPRLRFSIGRVRVNVPVRITYRVRISASVQLGNNTNVAIVSSVDGSGPSQPSRATTRITAGLFDERGAIVGKVYTQCNCASLMQEAGEVGIPGVRVYLGDGTSAVTDVEGKYSFYGVAARLHVVKVDRASLPQGAVMTPVANRNALDGYSRFADVKAGEMHKADFAEGSGSADVLRLVLARRRAGEVENAGTQIAEGAKAPQARTAEAPPQVDARGTPLTAPTGADSIRIAYTVPAAGVLLSQDSVSGTMRSNETYRPIATAGTLTELNSQLPVTPLRAQASRQGRNPLGHGRVQVELPPQGIPADGQTLVSVVVRVLDRDGNPLPGSIPATLEASLGRWLGDEINASEQGRQVVLQGGSGRYTLIAAAQPGRGEVRVTTPDGTQTVPITFVPATRPLMAVGLLNARIDFRSLIRGTNALASDADGFEESLRDWTFDEDSGKVRGGARGALLLKGRVFGDQLLTLSYDSERDRGRSLFRDIRPNEFFPVYGDASLREFDAQSRRRFYLRLDRGTSYTMFGDFQTTRADDRRMLAAYDRSLNGAVQHFEGRRGSGTLFASQGRLRQVVDEVPGRGISGPYVLSQAQGLVNSERVEIITRDRNQPTVILSRVPLTRFADYTIEPLTGRLLLRAPVPSADANLNPVSIRVTYESETATGDKYWVFGGDGSVRLSNAVELGATFAQDQNPGQKSTLAGINATALLAKGTVAFAEFAQSEVAGTSGDAMRLEVRHQSEKVEGRIFAARSDSAFSNQSSTFHGGRTEIGGRLSTALDAKSRLSAEVLRTANNTANDGQRTGALIAFERQLSAAWRAEFGYRYARQTGDFSPYPGGTPLQVNPGVIDNDVSALRGRLHWTLPEKSRSSLFAEYEQDIRDDSHRGALGGEYLIANRARLYGRHEWLTSTQGAYATNEGPSQQYTVFGIDADYLKNTQMFSEYRARDAFAGRDAEASIGLRNRWAIAPGLLVNTSFERVSPLYGAVGTGANAITTGDALAATGAVEWTRPALWRSTARLEFRDADNGDNFLASFGYARKLSRDWTLLGRTLWDVFDAQQNQTRGWTQLGLAWRETDHNKWNALVRYENRLTRMGTLGATPSTENLAHILASLVNYQPASRVTLSGRYAAKLARDDMGTLSTRTNAQLLMGRGIFDLNRRLDAGLIGSLLASDGFSSRRYGLGGELGLIVLRNLRVAGGYNLFGFTDNDLNTFGTTRKGAYLELGFKFDESLFGLGGSQVPCDNACRAGEKKE